MKKLYLVLMAIIFSCRLSACDICGCGVGNSYIGILPDFQKQIAGLRYRYNSIQSHVGVGGSNTYLTTNEQYKIVEAWSGWTFKKKLRIMLSVPYSFNEKVNQGKAYRKNGIGDISIAGFYGLINSRKNVLNNKLLVQNLWVGGSIKLATGKYNPADKSAGSGEVNLFQLGTGSNDFSIAGMYDIRLQDIGLNLTGNYKITSPNKQHYQYGNKFNLTAQGYYKFNIKNKCTIAPNAGLQYELSDYDKDHSFRVSASGGNLLLGTLGAEISFRKITFGTNFQTALRQNLANGIVRANNRMMLHTAFVF